MVSYAAIKDLTSRTISNYPMAQGTPMRPRGETERLNAKTDDPSLNTLVLSDSLKIPKPETLIELAKKRGSDPWQARVLGNEALVGHGKLSAFLDAALRLRLAEDVKRTQGKALRVEEILSKHSKLDYDGHNGSFRLRANVPKLGDLDFVRTEQDGRKIYEIRQTGSDGKGVNDLLKSEKYMQPTDGAGGWDEGSKILTVNYDKLTAIKGYNRFKFELGIRGKEWAGKISNKKLDEQFNEIPLDDSAFDFDIKDPGQLADALGLDKADFRA